MSYERLRAILESCGQLELLLAFEAEGYDDSLLSDITEEVLVDEIGIKGGGYRKKILKAIQAALASQCPPEPAPTTPGPSTAAPSPEGTKIFLSYGRRDAAEIAERLYRDLTAAGFEVWRDTQEIQAGSQWQDEIEAGLRSAHVVVSLLSPQAVRRGIIVLRVLRRGFRERNLGFIGLVQEVFLRGVPSVASLPRGDGFNDLFGRSVVVLVNVTVRVIVFFDGGTSALWQQHPEGKRSFEPAACHVHDGV